MCQDYILQQRQMQMDAQMEYNAQINPETIMGENGYKKVMQYVDAIGENLKTPKVKTSLSKIFQNYYPRSNIESNR